MIYQWIYHVFVIFPRFSPTFSDKALRKSLAELAARRSLTNSMDFNRYGRVLNGFNMKNGWGIKKKKKKKRILTAQIQQKPWF
jgi:hypothetical protein